MTNILLTNDFAKVSQVNVTENIDVLEINHQICQAKVSLYGGQVLSYQMNSSLTGLAEHKNLVQQDVFWLSKVACYKEGKAIRGGIPLCWPWFGANDKATSEVPSTNHGFAREVTWQVDSIKVEAHEVTLVLTLQGENQHALWPTAFKLEQTLVFGKTCKQSLTMTNLSTEDAHYSSALHSYFRVSNPENITINALTGCDFDDKLTAESSNQTGSVSCVGPIDRVYHSQSNNCVMLDSGWQRKIEVTSYGCPQWVLWNPGEALANNMADIHAEGENEFVCLEAANTKWQLLPAGKTITISQEIKVSAL